MIELTKKLVLTNIAILINFGEGGRDKLLRLVAGMLIAMIGLTVQFIAQPYHHDTDDALSCVSQLMLITFFLFGMLLKLCDNEGPDSLQSLIGAGSDADNSCSLLVGLDSTYTVAVLMLCMGSTVIGFVLVLILIQVFFSRSVPYLRVASTNEPPELHLGVGHRYHLFL